MMDIETVTCYERSVEHIRQTDTINICGKSCEGVVSKEELKKRSIEGRINEQMITEVQKWVDMGRDEVRLFELVDKDFFASSTSKKFFHNKVDLFWGEVHDLFTDEGKECNGVFEKASNLLDLTNRM